METKLLWAGLEYHSLEHCILKKSSKGYQARSTIIGVHEDRIYKVEYLVRTNARWETTSLELTAEFSERRQTQVYHGDGKGNWTKNGIPALEFAGCIDVDISLTPFTNSFPINRLSWRCNEPREIQVLFVDVLDQSTTVVRQCYTKRSDCQFKFETVPNDFEALLTFDASGFVLDYPGLFVRKPGN